MFPLNSNTPYVKDTGERARLGQILGGSDTPELPDYGIADAGKVLTVGEDGSLEWDTSGSGGGDSFLSYDFTKFGTRTGVHNVNFSSEGATFTNTSAYIPLSISVNDITLYVDVDNITTMPSDSTRFIMGSATEGLAYRNTGYWGLYASAYWAMSDISDPDFFDDSSVKVYIDSENHWHVYKDNVVVFEPTRSLSPTQLTIGSTNDYSIEGLIRGARIYNGNYTE